MNYEVGNQRDPRVLGIHAKPSLTLTRIMGIIPIVLIVLVYLTVSHFRHLDNPKDKLTPTFRCMYQEMKQVITVPDRRSGKIIFWEDTKASLMRLAIGISLSAVFGFMFGVFMGLYPGFKALFGPTITCLSNINPLALLGIILVVLGVGETSKIFLICFGIGIPITRSIQQAVEKIPKELIAKALTLGATEFDIITKIVTPQVIPVLIELIRVQLGSAFIFVIAAEYIAATEGLGYRIALQQRYMNMGLIIPYVLYISLLAYLMDTALQLILKRNFRWYVPEK